MGNENFQRVMAGLKDAAEIAEASAIERVARSIYEGRNGRGCRAWGSLEKSHREPYMKDAQCALAALTTPSETSPSR